jgi:hypothetical protein
MKQARFSSAAALMSAACILAAWPFGCAGNFSRGHPRRPANAEVMLVARGSLEGTLVPTG